MHETISIGELGHATGTKVETIRYYERIGLLPRPARTPGNHRVYSQAHLARLSFIRRARSLGFSLDQVRQLLALSDDRQCPCDEVDAIAQAHLGEIDTKIDHLSALRRELEDLVRQCRGGRIEECRIIGALSTKAAKSR